MVILVAVVSVTTGVPGALGSAENQEEQTFKKNPTYAEMVPNWAS